MTTRAQGREERLIAGLLERAKELHIIWNRSGRLTPYPNCELHGFESCSSPRCSQARDLAAPPSPSESDGCRFHSSPAPSEPPRNPPEEGLWFEVPADAKPLKITQPPAAVP
jgi:hypothetical protein